MANTKLVPADAIQDLMKGSFEHLMSRVAHAIDDSVSLFVEDKAAVGAIATFSDHVVVGSEDGRYFKVKFEDKDGQIVFGKPEMVDVPVVDESNSGEYVRKYVMETVDAMLSGDKVEMRDRLLALLHLGEEKDSSEGSDLSDMVDKLLASDRDWRKVYSEQKVSICAQVGDLLESIKARVPAPKYNELFDSIPEEQFSEHAEVTKGDLSLIADRLESIQTKAELAFHPFTEAVVKADQSEEEEEVLQQFASFSEDYLDDIQSMREHVAYALENEQCVMCIGKIHDALAEALTDYEIAGSFVERMSRQLGEAV